MKRLSLLLMSVVLLFGMTQCKKKVEPIAGETVHITLDVDSGGKHEVYPSTGAVVYTAGDVIYVGNGGKYVGSLTYANGAFSGTLTGVVTTDYLHFYFVSGLTPSDTPSAGSTTSFTVNISDQSSALPVLSYGKSNIMYTSGTTAYTSVLENKCGFVKFVLSTATSSAVTVSGMKNVATVSFASPGITATGATGNVTLYSESTTAKWAILLPQDAVASPTVSIDGYSCSAVTIPAVTNNMYYTDGVNIAITANVTITTTSISNIGPTTASSGGSVTTIGNVTARGICWSASVNPTTSDNIASEMFEEDEDGTGSFTFSITGLTPGETYYVRAYATVDDITYYSDDVLSFTTLSSVINGLFTVNSSGKQVYFSRGNLNITAVDTWGFETNQWDTHTDVATVSSGYPRYYFTWAELCNGNNDPKTFTIGNESFTLLSFDEWKYLLNVELSNGNISDIGTRDGTVSGYHYSKAQVHSTNGLVILPDDLSITNEELLPNHDTYNALFETISDENWTTLETAGCVFLPFSGLNTTGGSSSITYLDLGVSWSSTEMDNSRAYYVRFGNGMVHIDYGWTKNSGRPARLVTVIN